VFAAACEFASSAISIENSDPSIYRMPPWTLWYLPATYAPAFVSTPAAMAFDLIRYAALLGGIGPAMETLRPLLRRIRPVWLRAVLDAECSSSTTQRLGCILEKCPAHNLTEEVAACLTKRRWLQLSTMAARRQSVSKVEARWRLIDNFVEFGT
jgi:hypothetical protein